MIVAVRVVVVEADAAVVDAEEDVDNIAVFVKLIIYAEIRSTRLWNVRVVHALVCRLSPHRFPYSFACFVQSSFVWSTGADSCTDMYVTVLWCHTQ